MKDLYDSKKKIIAFLRRFHLVIFITVVMLILSVAVILLYSVAGKASGADSEPSSVTSSSFDQATIDRIKQLRSSSEPSESLNFSNGRINPFHE